ncbi:hypothetical protein [Candidatus Finniella inopinata]|nr:hypothetical protein [Candidatus Finniella inopinata]
MKNNIKLASLLSAISLGSGAYASGAMDNLPAVSDVTSRACHQLNKS